MAQTSYSINMGEGFAGLKVDSRDDHVESFQAQGNVPFGYGVGMEPGQTTQVRKLANDNATIAFDADFVTLNVINGTVNGVAIAPVTFATDHATTFAAVIAAYAAIAGITAVAGVGRQILLERIDGTVIGTVTMVVTAGAGVPTVTVSYSSDDTFRGISLHQHKEPIAGVVQYVNTESVDVCRKGCVWGEVSVAVTADQAAFVDVAAGTGKFTNVSTNNRATGGFFRSSTAGAGIAKVEINLP